MRITSKGQVTIPADIRERAGLLPHTEVEEYVRRKGNDIDRWLGGMRRLRRKSKQQEG